MTTDQAADLLALTMRVEFLLRALVTIAALAWGMSMFRWMFGRRWRWER